MRCLESQETTGDSRRWPRAWPRQHSSESQWRLQVKFFIQMLEDQPHMYNGTGYRGRDFSSLNFSFQISMKDADLTALCTQMLSPFSLSKYITSPMT